MVNVCTKYKVSTFGHSKDIKGVPIFRKWSRELSHAPLGVKFSYPTKGFTKCISQQNLVCVALSIRKLWSGSQISNSRDPDPAHFRGQVFVHWLVYVMVNVCAKYEVSIFGHSKDIKVVPKFGKWSRDLSHAPLGVEFSYIDTGLQAVY